MEVTVTIIDSLTKVLGISGRLNALSSPDLKAEIKKTLATGAQNLIIDLRGTDFVDSSGLSALVSGLKQTRESGGRLRLAGLNDQTLTVFKLTMLDRIFEIFPDVDHALGQ